MKFLTPTPEQVRVGLGAMKYLALYERPALEAAERRMMAGVQRSGMGLSLSQEIVQAHGGSIGISNRPEGGAWVRVLLPGRDRSETQDLTRSRLTLTHG